MAYSDQHYGPGEVDCPRCKGGGYIRYDVPYGHQMFGRIVECDCITAVSEGRRCGIADPDIWNRPPDYYWWGLKERLPLEEAVKDQVKRVKQGKLGGFTTLIAPPDGGQTTLLEWATVELAKLHKDVFYIVAHEFQRLIRDGKEGYIIPRMESCDVLLADQFPDWIPGRLAANQESRWLETVRAIIDNRYRLIRSKTTFFAVNLHWWETHDPYWEAVKSRMGIGAVVVREPLPLRAAINKGNK